VPQTHNLQGMAYNAAFVPSGCAPAQAHQYHAMTVGAGVGWQQVYDWADSLNITAIGGYHQTVGASGGWLTGGGHSVLSPVYGLGVDRVVQFKVCSLDDVCAAVAHWLQVVTPDGVYRTANECQNQDLFWALRGGGGNALGVVIESSSIVEPKAIPLAV
jgi:FAD/FMN-containing dehydrogenase